jgi:hypothetical protein
LPLTGTHCASFGAERRAFVRAAEQNRSAQDQYFVVQNIYRGWALIGIVLFGALIANLVLAILLRGRGRPFVFAIFAFFCIALSLAIFFVWTYPANQATDNWATIPANWEWPVRRTRSRRDAR